MACPICKSGQFYVKDPSDPFEIYEFQIENGSVQFDDPEDQNDASLDRDDKEIFCQKCSWHGKFELIK